MKWWCAFASKSSSTVSFHASSDISNRHPTNFKIVTRTFNPSVSPSTVVSYFQAVWKFYCCSVTYADMIWLFLFLAFSKKLRFFVMYGRFEWLKHARNQNIKSEMLKHLTLTAIMYKIIHWRSDFLGLFCLTKFMVDCITLTFLPKIGLNFLRPENKPTYERTHCTILRILEINGLTLFLLND